MSVKQTNIVVMLSLRSNVDGLEMFRGGGVWIVSDYQGWPAASQQCLGLVWTQLVSSHASDNSEYLRN